jgi:hypothetical protein
MEKKKLKNGDILLLFLFVDNQSPIVGRTRLQKMVYVFEKELKKKYSFDKSAKEDKNLSFNFEAYNYGPFSKEVFDLMEFFVNIEAVKVEYRTDDIEEAVDSIDDQIIFNDDMQAGVGRIEDDESLPGDPIYRITDKGISFVKDKLLGILSKEQIKAISDLKVAFSKYSLNQILKYVYSKYPDMTRNSLIRDAVLEKTWQF